MIELQTVLSPCLINYYEQAYKTPKTAPNFTSVHRWSFHVGALGVAPF